MVLAQASCLVADYSHDQHSKADARAKSLSNTDRKAEQTRRRAPGIGAKDPDVAHIPLPSSHRSDLGASSAAPVGSGTHPEGRPTAVSRMIHREAQMLRRGVAALLKS